MKCMISHKAFLVLLVIFILPSCTDNPYTQGKSLYTSYCVNCHMEDGSGLEKIIPPLDGADYLHKHPGKVACMIRYGAMDTIIVNGIEYYGAMPGYPELTETQITNIINYMNNAWSNDLGFTPLDSVYRWLENCSTE